MRIVLRQKSNNRIWASQVNGKMGVLKADFIGSGIPATDLEELEVSEIEYQTLLSNDPALTLTKEIIAESDLIVERATRIQNVRDKKEAVRQLKLEGKVFKHFDSNGGRV